MVRFSSDGGRRYLRVEGARPLQDVPQAASLPAARHEVYRRRVCHVSISSVREAVIQQLVGMFARSSDDTKT